MKDHAIANDKTATGHSGHEDHRACCHGNGAAVAPADEALIDPVCGMKVTRQSKHM